MNALLIIDVQNDFLPGGALGVKEGNLIINGINNILSHYDYCIYTKDWHPITHCSFATWPPHCIQYSYGAQFANNLIIKKDAFIIYKGTNTEIDSYSAFFDNDKQYSTPLKNYLDSQNIDTLYLCGLATDYCVKFSSLDAASLGYKTYVIANLTKAVNINSGDFDNAIREMENAGINIIYSK